MLPYNEYFPNIKLCLCESVRLSTVIGLPNIIPILVEYLDEENINFGKYNMIVMLNIVQLCGDSIIA